MGRFEAVVPALAFDKEPRVAAEGFGGLMRDRFVHGGILDLEALGHQRLGAHTFFEGDPVSTWTKRFGPCVVQAPAGAAVTVGGAPADCPYDRATGCFVIGCVGGEPLDIAVHQDAMDICHE